MDPVAGAQIALTVCNKIYEHAQLVKCNKSQCLRLAERTRIVVDSVKDLVAQLPVLTPVPPAGRGAPPAKQAQPTGAAGSSHAYTQALASLKQTLDSALLLVQSFAKKTWAHKVFSANSHNDKFNDIYTRLEQDMNQLNLGLNVHQVLKGQERKTQDAQDKQADYKDLLSKQDEILRLNQESQKQNQKLIMDEAHRHEVVMQQMESMKFFLMQMQPGKKHKAPISEKLLVPFYDLKIDGLLAEGSFGKVYKGRWLEQEVAIKRLERDLTEAERREFLSEVHIMKQLRSEYVMPLYAVCDEPKRHCIVMKNMEQGSLRSVLDKKAVMTANQRHQLILEIALGLHYLHSQDILHRDFKSGNVLIDCNGNARIADFGLSKLGAKSLFSNAGQTADIQWMPPEVIMHSGDNNIFTKEADVYSFGVVMWEILTGKMPYMQLNPGQVANKISKGEHEAIPHDAPKIYQDLLRECWRVSKNGRPSMGAIVDRLRQHAAPAEERRAQLGGASGYQNSPQARQAFWSPPSPSQLSQSPISKSHTEEIDADTFFMAGQMYESQQRFDKAISHYERACDLGYARAKTKLALHYMQGTAGLSADKQKGHALLKEAAEGGHATGMRSLAYQYEKADGVPQDLNQARHWYQQAADAGDGYAAEKLQKLNAGGQSPQQRFAHS